MIKLGNTKIGKIFLGDTKISKVYKGNELKFTSEVPMVTISFNKNYANSGTVANIVVPAGTEITLPTNKYTATGWTFNGWRLGSASGTKYAAGAKFVATANTVFYAGWTFKGWTLSYSGCTAGTVYANSLTQVYCQASYSQYATPTVTAKLNCLNYTKLTVSSKDSYTTFSKTGTLTKGTVITITHNRGYQQSGGTLSCNTTFSFS